MKAHLLEYQNEIKEYYPIEENNDGTYLDSSWNGTAIPVSRMEVDVDELWFVMMEFREWDESESVWKTIKRVRVSPYRLTQKQADEDFSKMGLIDMRKYKFVSAQTITIPNKYDVMFIVQRYDWNHSEQVMFTI